MSKQIWLAPILNDNRPRLIERCADLLATSGPDSFLYLAASRPLLDLVTTGLLDGNRNRGVLGTLRVLLFRGFVRHLLATAVDESGSPLAQRTRVDRDELPLKRSLIAQVMSRLAGEGKLKALLPLAHREGCINSVTALIGELQRAAKSPTEFAAIVEARASDLNPGSNGRSENDFELPRQSDFDREIASIYSAYREALDRSRLTEDDTDQLRALAVLRGEIDGAPVNVPWLSSVRLMVLDGFFDFTPAQGEMLRLLIPSIPNVIVNLNGDERNQEIFRPFATTLNQLDSIAEFETIIETEIQGVTGSLEPLRARLFNPMTADEETEIAERGGHGGPPVQLLECSDRQTEIRAIAKRIKRMILVEDYSISEIVLVVRELASYTEAITRIFREESIPCSLERRVSLIDVSSARAATKLFQLLIDHNRESRTALKVGALADLVKSGYFRLSETELDKLRGRFNLEARHLLSTAGFRKRPAESGVGEWNVDELENAIAFVGAELRLDRWLKRASQLTGLRTKRTEEELQIKDDEEPGDDGAEGSEEAIEAQRRPAIRREPVEIPIPGSERRPKPAREIHPALIAWSALVIERLGGIIAAVPPVGSAGELRDRIVWLLTQLQFAGGVKEQRLPVSEAELPAITFDLRGLEGLRRALSGAVRSIEVARSDPDGTESSSTVKLVTFLEETLRCARAQSLTTAGADPDVLRVLEATDIRGLRFRAVFIAGLVEGGFPLRASRDWIYPHEERARLKDYGLTLEDISPETLLKEEHYFYQTACRATERLYLTRPLVLEDGQETVLSYYVEELFRAISPDNIAAETVGNDFEGRRLFESSRVSELATLLVRQEERRRHRAQRDGNFSDETLAQAFSKARQRGYLSEPLFRRIAIERERGGPSFGSFDGIISATRLIRALRGQYGTEHSFSASELSLYGKCPFKFYAERVLRLEPRGEAALDLSALDAGSLLHEALKRFFEGYRGKRLSDFDRGELMAELRAVADEVFAEHERRVPALNQGVWSIDRQMRQLLLEQVLNYELTVQAATRDRDVRPAHFELAFGMRSDDADPSSTDRRLELKRITRLGEETVHIRGQIDRVDIAGDGTTIAYDYKLSKGANLADMEEGRALQLHIYLAALEQLFFPGSDTAGGGYYAIRGAQERRNKGLYRNRFHEYTDISRRVASNLSEAEWRRIRDEMESRVWEFIDGMRMGRFQVEPSSPESTCPHCDYSAVCRYEKFRIRKKAE